MLYFSNKQSHICNTALVAFVFFGYNIDLIKENMIKPNTLCLIRGVPHEQPGHEFNGNIVTVQGFKDPENRIYWIEPKLVDSHSREFTGCREQWLWPFQDPDTLGLTNKTLETA